MLLTRQTGTLLPLFSLPGAPACGDLGPAARRFVDYLQAHGVQVWQFLPLHPTEAALGNSPYSAQSVYAGDERYLSVDDLVDAGYLSQAPAVPPPSSSAASTPSPSSTSTPSPSSTTTKVDYEQALRHRQAAVEQAFREKSARVQGAFQAWREQHAWVGHYAVWRAIANEQGTVSWTQWPAALRDAQGAGVGEFQAAHQEAIDRIAFGQYLFASQWTALHAYAESRGVKLFGDVPIYPHLDSSDVWAGPANFQLSPEGRPLKVAGVPPDYFSADGQLWGNPVYNWRWLARDGFRWWVERMRYAFQQFDLVRLDHFIGLVRAYEIPADHTNARHGTYVQVPTEKLFRALTQALPAMPLIAEDLGTELDSVALFMSRWRLPGMKVLQFGFGGDAANPHLPHNIPPHAVAYSGTHDNNTLRGWIEQDADARALAHLQQYLGHGSASSAHLVSAMLRQTLASAARMAVLPVQDILGLDHHSRVNTPGTVESNWTWRIAEEALYADDKWAAIHHMSQLYGRAPEPAREDDEEENDEEGDDEEEEGDANADEKKEESKAPSASSASSSAEKKKE